MRPTEWHSRWIGRRPAAGDSQCEVSDLAVTTREDPGCTPPNPLLRREFSVKKRVRDARLYASGLGYGIYWINGRRAGRQELAPAFTDFGDRTFYIVEDVTELIRRGNNAIGAELGRGFYSITESDTVHGYDRAEWHAEPSLRLELHITYRDGSSDSIRSGSTWRATAGPVVYDNLFRGETYDGIRSAELRQWAKPSFDDSAWSQVRAVAGPAGGLRAQAVEPEKVIERLRFTSIREPEPGIYVLDLGQDVSGWTRINVRGERGDLVRIVHGEKLTESGRVAAPTGSEPALIDPDQTDFYRLVGRPLGESYRPRFVFHGFRYVEISGWPQGSRPTLDDVSAEVVHTDLREAGTFAASAPLLGKIVGNTSRAIRHNAHGFPSDTPVYEKTGWTGDGQIMAPSWAWLFDTERFHAKWSADIVDAQGKGGAVPEWAPASQTQLERLEAPGTTDAPPGTFAGPWPGWDVALFSVPWDVYRYQGNVRPLARAYAAMKRYVRRTRALARGGALPAIADGHGPPGLGDWATVKGAPAGAWPDANAWWHRMHEILAGAARVLGRKREAATFDASADRIRVRFNRLFLDREAGLYRDPSDEEGRYSQHVNATALELGLVPAGVRSRVAESLAGDILRRRHRLNTGVIGTRFLWPALSRNGFLGAALGTALTTSYPSYGYWIERLGWTSLGEYWEQDSRSRSHHFLGSIVQWLFEDLAGIRPVAPGFARIAFRPQVPKQGLGWVRATHDSPRGPVASSWSKTKRGLRLSVELPPNTTGSVGIPASSRKLVDASRGARLRRCANGLCVYRVSSGRYEFRARQRSSRRRASGR